MAGRNNRGAVTREVTLETQSVVTGIFQGAQCSTLKASNMKPSATVVPWLVLQLNITGAGVGDVSDAFAEMTRSEEVQFRAEGSRAESPATKTVKLQRAPRVLVLHLVRFTWSEGEGESVKLDKHVRFGTRFKVKGSWISQTAPEHRTGGVDYELFATVTHYGKTPFGGHYTADVRTGPDGEWYRFDDERVGVVREQEVLQQQAYLLFYRRLEA